MTRHALLLICAPLLLGLAASAPSFAVRKESHSETAAADVLGRTVVKVMPAVTAPLTGPEAPRRPKITGISHIAFFVADLPKIFVQSLPGGVEAQDAGKFAPASRLSANIYHVGFLVGNSGKSMDFYGKMLGFQETWRGSSSSKELSWINLRVPDGVDYVEFMLYRTPLAKEQYGTKNHVALEVADAQGAIATLEARPAFKNYPKPLAVQIGKNGKRQVNVFDPDGSCVELMEPRTIDGKAVPSSTAAPPPNVYN